MTQWPETLWPASQSRNRLLRPKRLAGSAAAAGQGSGGRGRVMAAMRAWVAAGQLGPHRDTAIGVTPAPDARERTTTCQTTGNPARSPRRRPATGVLLGTEELAADLGGWAGSLGRRILEVDEDTEAYGRGHLPGAVAVHWRDDLQDPAAPRLHRPPSVRRPDGPPRHHQPHPGAGVWRQQQLVRRLRLLVLALLRPPGRAAAGRRPQGLGAGRPPPHHPDPPDRTHPRLPARRAGDRAPGPARPGPGRRREPQR